MTVGSSRSTKRYGGCRMRDTAERMIYCNQLGTLVEFSYCMTMNDTLPCRNSIGCWTSRGDIVAYLRDHFTVDQLKQVFEGPPKSRIDRIVDTLSRET